jgi:hypothetical protein
VPSVANAPCCRGLQDIFKGDGKGRKLYWSLINKTCGDQVEAMAKAEAMLTLERVPVPEDVNLFREMQVVLKGAISDSSQQYKDHQYQAYVQSCGIRLLSRILLSFGTEELSHRLPAFLGSEGHSLVVLSASPATETPNREAVYRLLMELHRRLTAAQDEGLEGLRSTIRGCLVQVSGTGH